MRTVGGCASISNDRVFLGFEGGEATARGMPSALRVRSRVESEFPELRSGLPARERHYLYSEAELAGPILAIGEPAEELIINPAQMARLLGAPRAAAAPIGTISSSPKSIPRRRVGASKSSTPARLRDCSPPTSTGAPPALVRRPPSSSRPAPRASHLGN